MNVGFLEARKMEDNHCFVFHDVDMIPENDRNMYMCPKFPRHMSPALDKFDYEYDLSFNLFDVILNSVLFVLLC